MNSRSKSNPFAQSPVYWKVTFIVPRAALATAENAFDDIALSVSQFEVDDQGREWRFDLLFEAPPDMEELQRRMLLLSSLYPGVSSLSEVQQVQPQDWLSQVARDFPPLSIGRFYVHGAHVEDAPPGGAFAIQVDAGAAFGSGEHGTTRGCLEALEWLARKRSYCPHILDMGCGSGILAIAAAKLWRGEVLAVDIDPVAVRVTQDNIQINRVASYVKAAVSDGYDSERVKRAAPYDVIVSNILARPLVQFAPDLARYLKEGGTAILSGLLTSQETQVLSAHMMQGLKLQKRFVHKEWCALVLAR